MKINWILSRPYFGEIPDGEIVKVWFRLKTKKVDWAIYSFYR